MTEPMTDPPAGPTSEPLQAPLPEPDTERVSRAEPGDRPPSGRLGRPPSDRFAKPGSAGARGGATLAVGGGLHRRADAAVIGRALAPAIGAALVTAAALVLVGGVLAGRQGLLGISGLGGAFVGLLAAGAAVSPDATVVPALTRGGTTKAAIAIAMLAILIGALGTWAYGRLEGGVMDPLAYLWETLGPYLPVEALLAAIAAAWGAGAGPIRGRS